MTEERAITVGELVALLGKVDQSREVNIEGCDCSGNAAGIIEKDTKGWPPSVLIFRPDGYYVDEPNVMRP